MDSEPGRGSVLWFSVPLDAVDAAPAGERAPVETALVAMPDGAACAALAEDLRAQGVRVRVAGDVPGPAAGLREEPPALVILDDRLLAGDGAALADGLADAARPPAIVRGTSSVRRGAPVHLPRGVQVTIARPVRWRQLCEAVRRAAAAGGSAPGGRADGGRPVDELAG